MFDRGTGTPVVVVQPLQGRWEWTRPVLVALSAHARVVSYSLSGDAGGGTEQNGFEALITELGNVMNASGLQKAALCGISFGGTVAVRFAARFPERVTQLVVASSPGPGWAPTSTQSRYVARPWRSVPAFALGGVARVGPEIRAARGAWRAGAFAVRYAAAALRYPAMPHVIARRVRLLAQLDLTTDCSRIGAPTLVVTGDPQLDRIVPVASTRRYAELIPGARYVMMDNTGHLGALTQPKRFAALVNEFIHASHS